MRAVHFLGRPVGNQEEFCRSSPGFRIAGHCSSGCRCCTERRPRAEPAHHRGALECADDPDHERSSHENCPGLTHQDRSGSALWVSLACLSCTVGLARNRTPSSIDRQNHTTSSGTSAHDRQPRHLVLSYPSMIRPRSSTTSPSSRAPGASRGDSTDSTRSSSYPSAPSPAAPIAAKRSPATPTPRSTGSRPSSPCPAASPRTTPSDVSSACSTRWPSRSVSTPG